MISVERSFVPGLSVLDIGLAPAFGHCVDGLIRVDLGCLKPAKRRRYLGARPR